MKKIFIAASAIAVLAFGACSDLNSIKPEGGTLLADQLNESIEADPTRADAVFNGLFTKLGEPGSVFPKSSDPRPDDFGFIMSDFSNDLETGDIVLSDNGYNWFSVCGELTSRNADYANPYIRYASCYNEIAAAHDVLKAFPADSEDPIIQAKIGQAYAIRAYAYLRLVPYYQFSYEKAADQPCIPIVTLETEDFTNNPRATVAAVYDLIIADLNTAIEKLEAYSRPDKSKIDQQTAYGLRARAYLYMGKYAEALADAQNAAEGYTPASIAEVSSPTFKDISEHNWIWGYDMTTAVAAKSIYSTSSAWVRSFSGDSYSAGTGTYARINNILYVKIPATDVRKGWWVDENLASPLLDGQVWGDLKGQEIATGTIENVKMVFDPYTNVKFGMDPIGNTTNAEDWPFMRVEEMLLIQAECLAKTGKTAEAEKVLTDFVKTYRDPAYNVAATGRSLEDEIWFQRRIELWGEGLANPDVRRLNKPVVRFIDAKTSIVPEAFRFNMTADDGWMLLRFCTDELNTNFAIVDNQGGALPLQDQNPDLRDGVTD